VTSLALAFRDRLPAYTLFSGVISAAGLPIYIYAPKYYADTFGVSLTTLGAILFALRLFDVVQDPALGWLSERLDKAKAAAVALSALVMALSMIALFVVPSGVSPLWWFAISITFLFTAFSFLTITFYAQGISKAGSIAGGHVRLAAWRETGSLLGVCVAAVAPTVLMVMVDDPFAAFAWGFAAAALLAVVLMWPEWKPSPAAQPISMSGILRDPIALRLMVLAMVNATPLAVTSTLFLFFVESRLGAPGWEGPLLVLFFLAAALSSPVWGFLAQRHGEKPVLLVAMVLAVASFLVTFTLGTGDVIPFALICVLSGATIGADLTLLPAMFARRMAVVAPQGGQGFGLWSLMNKLTLAFAAATVLPLLEGAGFVAGSAELPEAALDRLTFLYALVPLGLKLIAIALLTFTRLKD
jgi:GPH family glycoside/pentoside/hexuronide:cation symporter